ncbi:MAG: glycoside hydrolase family 88 protein [Sedimentisphaerales bacterium]|nr:glycoside hydrolase family 88 protein [Sedimentisphaerales bacterium]
MPRRTYVFVATCLAFIWLGCVCLPCPAATFEGQPPLIWAARMADSQIIRMADRPVWTWAGKARWDYTTGLFALALLRFNEKVPNPLYVEYAEALIGSFVDPNGRIRTYRLEDYNLDNINPGKALLALWQLTGQQRYRKAAESLRAQLLTHPRTSQGGFWHKQRYPHQMWLDGIYMASPFYAEYGRLFGEHQVYDDVVKQITLISRHTYDPNKGLFYHGWDESRQQDWANKSTGTSANFWGRGMGWFAMACVDVLDFIPTDHPGRPKTLEVLEKVCQGIARYQDPASGLWYQVLDQGGRQGNYLEASVSSMFVYTLAKAMNNGYIDRGYESVATKGFEGLVTRLVKVDPNGLVALTQCCAVAGLGYGRDGSYQYYLSEPIVDNDRKAVGPFILAGLQLQQLYGLPIELGTYRPNPRLIPAVKWATTYKILENLRTPVFPDTTFSIMDFGAEEGKDASAAIAKAIEACAAAGGGRVQIPPGTFITGPIHLRSNVNLHLGKGATLLFKTDPNAYLPQVLTRFEGMECWNYSPLVYAYAQTNVAITGDGTLDGQASDRNWWSWKTSQSSARRRLVQMVADNVPVDKRRFGNGDNLRPPFIQFYRCEDVLIEGIHIRRSPMWNINPVLCKNVVVRNVDVLSHGPNNDGCNPESCRYVLIEGCTFDTGDDCIAIKSGRNNDGRRIGIPSQDIIIRRCTMKDGHGGVTIGSEISGGCSNVFADDCRMDSPNLDRVLRFKSNAVRGGIVEDIYIRRISVGQVADAVLQIDHAYEEGANGAYQPIVKNVFMQEVQVQRTPRILNVVGIPNGQISNVWVIDSLFNQVRRPDIVRQAQVQLLDCTVKGKD